MAYAIFGWSIAVMTACDGLMQSIHFNEELSRIISIRRAIIAHDQKVGQEFCKVPSPALHWQLREEGIWTDVCSSFTGYSNLPRYWKLQLEYKYKLLFNWEIPITVTIVILA
jgi:hypothetical protein